MTTSRPLSERSVVCIGSDSQAPAHAARVLRDFGADVLYVAPAHASRAQALLLGRDPGVETIAATDLAARLGDRPVAALVHHGALSDTVRDALGDRRPNRVTLSWVKGSEPGTDVLTQATAGVSHVIGEADRAPLWFPSRMGEYLHGMNAAGMVTYFELLGREGAEGEIALSDLWGYCSGTNWLLCVPKGIPYRREGRRSPGNGGVYCHRIFKARDGFIALLSRGSRDWRAFLEGMGQPEWAANPRYQDLLKMGVLYPDEVDALVEAETMKYTRSELFLLGREHGFPVAPVRSPLETLEDEFLERQGFWATLDGEVRAPGSLWREETWLESVGSTPDAPAADAPAAEAAGSVTVLHEPPAPGTRTDLSGWRVLDLSWVWAGPMVGSFLADLGAEVIKVEHAKRLDNLRLRGKLPGGDQIDADPRETDPLFHNVNRGKKSLLLDMKSPQGREVFLELVKQSDVILESFRPHVLGSWGLDYDTLRAANPGIVLLSLRGLELDESFGPSGLRSYAPITSSLSGMESVIRYEGETEPVGGMALGISDPVAGYHGLTLVLAAMVQRARTGRGGWIRLSQLETLASILPELYLEAQGAGDDRSLTERPVVCADGDVMVAASAARWDALLDGPVARGDDGDLHAGSAASLTGAAGDDLLAAEVLPCEAHQDWPAITGRTIIGTVEHAAVGKEQLYGHGWCVDAEPVLPRTSAPLIGQDTRALVRELLGLSDDAIDQLEADGVLT